MGHCMKNLLGVSLVVALLASFGCGGGQVIEKSVAEKAAPAAAPQTPDAYRDFGGKHVKLGSKFRLGARPMGVQGAELVIELVKTVWTTRELPSGKEVKDGTADLLVKKGEKSRRVRLDEGASRVIYGVKIEVLGAGEDYDKSRLDYLPWVDLKVTKG